MDSDPTCIFCKIVRGEIPGRKVYEDADILGLAAANAAAVASGAFVVSGSLTQTAMGERAGASSQVAQLATAAIVGLVLLFFTGPLQYLPRCLLAAIVFTIAVGLVDVRGLSITDPLAMESEVNQWPGVVTVGIFARHKAGIAAAGRRPRAHHHSHVRTGRPRLAPIQRP